MQCCQYSQNYEYLYLYCIVNVCICKILENLKAKILTVFSATIASQSSVVPNCKSEDDKRRGNMWDFYDNFSKQKKLNRVLWYSSGLKAQLSPKLCKTCNLCEVSEKFLIGPNRLLNLPYFSNLTSLMKVPCPFFFDPIAHTNFSEKWAKTT